MLARVHQGWTFAKICAKRAGMLPIGLAFALPQSAHTAGIFLRDLACIAAVLILASYLAGRAARLYLSRTSA